VRRPFQQPRSPLPLQATIRGPDSEGKNKAKKKRDHGKNRRNRKKRKRRGKEKKRKKEGREKRKQGKSKSKSDLGFDQGFDRPKSSQGQNCCSHPLDPAQFAKVTQIKGPPVKPNPYWAPENPKPN
jgi:hypothetical protein